MNVQIEESWKQHIGAEFEKPYFSELVNFVRQEYSTTTCYPPGREIFNAFNLCPFDKVKVVIIGQDPYHEPGQAEGLCFSVTPFGFLAPMGRTGCAITECYAYSESASGGFTSTERLGGIHGCSHSGCSSR